MQERQLCEWNVDELTAEHCGSIVQVVLTPGNYQLSLLHYGMDNLVCRKFVSWRKFSFAYLTIFETLTFEAVQHNTFRLLNIIPERISGNLR
jgi:hypothetical protein